MARSQICFPFTYFMLMALILLGCSGQGASGITDMVTSPDISAENQLLLTQHGLNSDVANPNFLWGFYWAYVDVEANIWEVIPSRVTSDHFNVREMLEDGFPCTDCLQILSITPQPDDLVEINIRLKHPLQDNALTGFDVRAIAMWDGTEVWPDSLLRTQGPEGPDGYILNPDGYTTLFNPTFYQPGSDIPLYTYTKGKFATETRPNSTLNPYIEYYTDEDRHMFRAGYSQTRTWEVKYPSSAFVLGYAVSACWGLSDPFPPQVLPDDFPIEINQPEPYRVEVKQPYPLGLGVGSTAGIEVTVWDWQNDPGGVWLECPDLWDGKKYDNAEFFNGEATIFSVAAENQFGTPPGTYRTLLGALDSTSTSTYQWDNIAYPFFDIPVAYFENNPPTAAAEAEQYSAYMGENIIFHSLSTDPEGQSDIVNYLWDFENDGVWDLDETDPSWSYDTAGVYYVDHKVIDYGDLSDDLEPGELLEITIINPCCDNPPVAVITGGIDDIITNQLMTLTNASYDPDHDPGAGKICPVTVEWDLDGDGTYDGVTDDQVKVAWDEVGINQVGLRATDACGLVDTTTVQTTVHVGVTLEEDQAHKLIGARYGYADNSYTVAEASALGVDVDNPNGPWDFKLLDLTDNGNYTTTLDPNHPEVALFKDGFTNYDFFYKIHFDSQVEGYVGYIAERYETGPDRLVRVGLHQSYDYPGTDIVPSTPMEFFFPFWFFTNDVHTFNWGSIFDYSVNVVGYGEGLVTTPYPWIVNEPCVVLKTEIQVKILGSPVLGSLGYSWYLDDGTLCAFVVAYNTSAHTGYDYDTGLITGDATFNGLCSFGAY